MDDAVTRYRTASEANDIDAMMATFTPTIAVVSPISGRMVFRGTEDVRILLEAVYSSMSELRWSEAAGDGRVRALVGEARVGPLRLGDAMVIELAPDGRIERFSPHLRPWLSLTLLALILGPKVGRHPAVVLRALRRR